MAIIVCVLWANFFCFISLFVQHIHIGRKCVLFAHPEDVASVLSARNWFLDGYGENLRQRAECSPWWHFHISDHQRAVRAKESREHRIQWVQGRRCARQGIPAGAEAILFDVSPIHRHISIAFQRRRRWNAENRTFQINFGAFFLKGTSLKWFHLSASFDHFWPHWTFFFVTALGNNEIT